ncbi:hypothetical protein ES703_123849 [subsurface metagenome]
MAMSTAILTFAGYCLPGFKAGRPIKTIHSMADNLGEEFQFKIIGPEVVSGFAGKMILLVRNRKTTKRLGSNAGKLACRFTTEWAADQMEKAAAVATGYENGNAGK